MLSPLRYALPFVLALFLVACGGESQENTTATDNASQAEEGAPTTYAEVEYAELSHDFGQINQGEKVSHKFTFRNVGTVPYEIKDVKTSCGCTSKDYSKEPVPPGEEGYVVLEYNSEGHEGATKKSATILGNTKTPVTLRFDVEVLTDGSSEEAAAN